MGRSQRLRPKQQRASPVTFADRRDYWQHAKPHWSRSVEAAAPAHWFTVRNWAKPAQPIRANPLNTLLRKRKRIMICTLDAAAWQGATTRNVNHVADYGNG